MTQTPEERIRELARKNAIGDAEAARLLAAISPTAPISAPSKLNPFERLSTNVQLAIGVVCSLAMLALAPTGIRADGAMDLHRASHPIALHTALIDAIIAFPFTALVFWLISARFSKTRFIDILGTIALSRVPVVVCAAVLSLFPHPVKSGPLLIPVALIALVDAGLQITTLVVGLRTATTLRGGRLAAVFIGAFVVAEVLSKLILAFIPT